MISVVGDVIRGDEWIRNSSAPPGIYIRTFIVLRVIARESSISIPSQIVRCKGSEITADHRPSSIAAASSHPSGSMTQEAAKSGFRWSSYAAA